MKHGLTVLSIIGLLASGSLASATEEPPKPLTGLRLSIEPSADLSQASLIAGWGLEPMARLRTTLSHRITDRIWLGAAVGVGSWRTPADYRPRLAGAGSTDRCLEGYAGIRLTVDLAVGDRTTFLLGFGGGAGFWRARHSAMDTAGERWTTGPLIEPFAFDTILAFDLGGAALGLQISIRSPWTGRCQGGDPSMDECTGGLFPDVFIALGLTGIISL